jgi:DNA-binding response OmpR family regulator
MAMTSSPHAHVAIFNASDDTVDMLTDVFTADGLRCVNGRYADLRKGALDFVAFIETHQPQVLIFDISLPYDRNWNFFKMLRQTDVVKGRHLVVTTTNKAALNEIVGEETGVLEIIGKPYEMDALSNEVRRVLAQPV